MTPISYDRPNLDIEYDGVAIIDGLEERNRADWKISDTLVVSLDKESIPTALFKCRNGPGAIEALSRVCALAEAGRYYCLHMVAHGNEDGIRIGSADFLGWREFGNALVPINRAMSGQLIVNMTTCFGIYALKSVDFGPEKDPFFGVIGVKHKLLVPDAVPLNGRIYRLWFGGMPINEIVHDVNRWKGGEFLYCGSAEGFRKLRSS